MSHETQNFHGKFLNFTREYLCVTMCGLPRVSEVTVELYRSYAYTTAKQYAYAFTVHKSEIY